MTQRYEEKLNTALEMADICTFKYFPKEHMCINSDAICRIYGCKKICMNMPEACADIFVSNNNQSDYYLDVLDRQSSRLKKLIQARKLYVRHLPVMTDRINGK